MRLTATFPKKGRLCVSTRLCSSTCLPSCNVGGVSNYQLNSHQERQEVASHRFIVSGSISLQGGLNLEIFRMTSRIGTPVLQILEGSTLLITSTSQTETSSREYQTKYVDSSRSRSPTSK